MSGEVPDVGNVVGEITAMGLVEWAGAGGRESEGIGLGIYTWGRRERLDVPGRVGHGTCYRDLQCSVG